MLHLGDYRDFLRRRGPLDTLRFAMSSLLDAGFDLAHGTSTGGELTATQLAPDAPDIAREATCYRPTRARPLRRLLRAAIPEPRGSFVDYGCGKGRALLIAAEHGFTDLIGVEYSASCCDIARDQVARGQARLPAMRASIVQGDAACFDPPHDASVFYFYNPFSERVMQQCLARIAASLDAAPRPHLIIYHHNMLLSGPRFAGFDCVATQDFSANLFHLYRRTAPGAPAGA